MVTSGGEVAFVSRMIDESLVLRDRVQWYTSMLGKFASIEALVPKLKKHGVGNYAVTEFVQGSKTRRWALGWSFADLRPGVEVARGVGSLQKGLLPFPGEYVALVGLKVRVHILRHANLSLLVTRKPDRGRTSSQHCPESVTPEVDVETQDSDRYRL